MTTWDVAITGLGAIGSAVARHLARAGARVIGFDALEPPHTMGSSHGHTRIIREAYYEHPLYVPLVRRAYQLWEELEREAGEKLMHLSGGIMAGPPDGPVFAGARASAEAHGIAHEILDADQLRRRYPMYVASPGTVALVEARAGVLFPERCIGAQLAGAEKAGARLCLNEAVTGWSASSSGVAVTTTAGRYTADRLLVCAGAWLPEIAAAMGIRVPVAIERQLSHWFAPVDEGDTAFRMEHCPVGLWEVPGGELFATLPDEGHGLKCGMHHDGGQTTARTVNRHVSEAENEAARAWLSRFAPRGAGRLLDARVCLYTNTPDRHFIVDWLDDGRVLLLSPCSGHGFKFASAIGELASQLVTTGRTDMDITPFSLRRLA